MSASGRDVEVTQHALRRARGRHHFDAALTNGELAARIVLEVHDAAAAGRVSHHKPVWALLYQAGELCGRKARPLPLPKGQSFVWNASCTLGWVVVREARRDVVVTCMHRVRAPELAAA